MAWKYQDVLNADLAILLTIALGLVSLVTKIFERADTVVFSKFLFKFCLAASVCQGLGLKTDLLDPDIWRFVGAFLVMRAIMLGACTLVFGVTLKGSLGEVTANWMATTWISTVILGTPILKALLGAKYASLGVVAGISSFIFQLPIMLVLFEVHAWRQEHLAPGLPSAAEPPPPPPPRLLSQGPRTAADYHPAAPERQRGAAGGELEGSSDQELLKAAGSGKGTGHNGESDGGEHVQVSLGRPRSWAVGLAGFRLSKSQLKGIGLRLLHNNVLWGCAIGIILSLSKIGPKWLNPGTPPCQPNCTYAIGTGFIAMLLDYFARSTEPVALFSTGMWMHQKNPLGCGGVQAALYMLVKLVLVPALMVGCAFAVGLDGAYGRAAVLVAALPVSSATFALCKTYNVGEAVAVSNVVLGNLLILPTTIAWLSFMDAVNLFEVGKLPAVPNPCNAPVKKP